MGYRNYFGIIEKGKAEEFNSFSHEEKMKVTSEVLFNKYKDKDFAQKEAEEYLEGDIVYNYLLRDYLQVKEIIELGKYFDSETAEKMKEDCIDFSDEDTEFCIVKPEALLICADHFKQKSIEWYKNVIRSFKMTDEECEKDKNLGYRRPNIEGEFRSTIYTLETLEINKERILEKDLLIDSWNYEHDMFNLIYLYKTIDWNKFDSVWLGH